MPPLPIPADAHVCRLPPLQLVFRSDELSEETLSVPRGTELEAVSHEEWHAMCLFSECFVILMFLSNHILKPSLQRMHDSCMHAHYNTTLKTHSYAVRALALSTDLDRSDMTVRTRISVKYITLFFVFCSVFCIF